jgi:hypothetical protein
VIVVTRLAVLVVTFVVVVVQKPAHVVKECGEDQFVGRAVGGGQRGALARMFVGTHALSVVTMSVGMMQGEECVE